MTTTRLIWGDESPIEFSTSKLEIDDPVLGRLLVRSEGGNRAERKATLIALLDAAREMAMEGKEST